jgi:signal transduction histidine kinase
MLWVPAFGALTAAVTSLGIALAISVAYSYVYTTSLGRPAAAELAALQQLTPRVQAVGSTGSYLVLFAGAYLTARRWAVCSTAAAMGLAALLMAAGAWLGAVPFLIAYGGHVGVGAVGYWILDFGIVATGMFLGERARMSVDGLRNAAALVRNGSSIETMLLDLSREVMRGPARRALLFRVADGQWQLVGDTSTVVRSPAPSVCNVPDGLSSQRGLWRLTPEWLATQLAGMAPIAAPAWGLWLNCPNGPEGLLVLQPGPGGSLLRADRDAWSSMAEQFALAWHRLVLLEQVREAARKDERQRLSHVIHDGLAQDLISALLYVETAQQGLARERVANPTLTEVERIVRQCLATARGLAWSSWGRPEPSGNGIRAALAQVTAQWAKQTSIELRFESVGEEAALDEATFELVVSATREALNNVRKHANATAVCVTLTFLSGQLALDIGDNGEASTSSHTANADGSCTAGGGFGLATLRQRVAKLNGQFVIERAPGEGFTLSIQLPLGNP